MASGIHTFISIVCRCFTLGRPSKTAHFGLKSEKGILDSRWLLYPLAADVLCLRGDLGDRPRSLRNFDVVAID